MQRAYRHQKMTLQPCIFIRSSAGDISINKPDSALFYANGALKLSEALKYERGIAQAYNDIAATMFYNGNYNRALELHLKALQIREKIKDSLGISSSPLLPQLHLVGGEGTNE